MSENPVYETEFVENNPDDNAKNMDFYKKLRIRVNSFLAKHPNVRFANYLAAVPDVFYLMIRLAADKRVPIGAKVKLAGAVSYFILPIDIVPDFIPMAGLLDDLVVSVTLLNRALDEIDPAIVDEHWMGEGQVYDFVKGVLDKGDKLVGAKAWNVIRRVFGKK